MSSLSVTEPQKLAYSSDVRSSNTMCCSRASLELHMCITSSKYNISSSLVVSSWMLLMYFAHFWSFFLLKDLKCPLLLLSNTLGICTHAAVLKRIQPFHIWKWSGVLPEYRHTVRQMSEWSCGRTLLLLMLPVEDRLWPLWHSCDIEDRKRLVLVLMLWPRSELDKEDVTQTHRLHFKAFIHSWG